jgi:hypothetical protein
MVVVKSHSWRRTMIIWKAAIPEMIVTRCFRAKGVILISRLLRTHSRTLYLRALPDRLSAVDVVAAQPQVRHCECQTSLRDKDNACVPNRAAAVRGKRDECTSGRTQQSSYQKVGQGCIGSLVSDIRRVLIVQPSARPRRQSPLLEAGRRLSSSLGSARSKTDRLQTPHLST